MMKLQAPEVRRLYADLRCSKESIPILQTRNYEDKVKKRLAKLKGKYEHLQEINILREPWDVRKNMLCDKHEDGPLGT